MPLLLGACPSFCNTWGEHQREGESEMLYVACGAFAAHLLGLQRRQQTGEFCRVAEVLERFHLEGDGYVRELATIGFLEGIQNVWSNQGADPESFMRYLLPESAKWWRSLNDFWNGKSKFVGEGL